MAKFSNSGKLSYSSVCGFYFNFYYGFAFPITFFFYFLYDLPPYLRTTKNPSKLEFFINLV